MGAVPEYSWADERPSKIHQRNTTNEHHGASVRLFGNAAPVGMQQVHGVEIFEKAGPSPGTRGLEQSSFNS